MSAIYREKSHTRRSIIEMEKAMSSIHNVAISKLGTTLLSNSLEDRMFSTQLKSLKQQDNRMQNDMNKKKRELVQRIQLLPEPTILLERQTPMDIMRPATSLPTIDAFKIERTTKNNTWDNVRTMRPQLNSIHVPYQKLTREEKLQLHKRNALHRKKQDAVMVMHSAKTLVPNVIRASSRMLNTQKESNVTIGNVNDSLGKSITKPELNASNTFITAVSAGRKGQY